MVKAIALAFLLASLSTSRATAIQFITGPLDSAADYHWSGVAVVTPCRGNG